MRKTLLCVVFASIALINSGCGGPVQALPDVVARCGDRVCNQETEFCNMVTDLVTCLPNHCKNGQPDGGETDRDCGGTCKPAYLCGQGKHCNDNTDCIAGLTCQNGVCTGTPTNNCGPTNCVAPLVCVDPATGLCQQPGGGGGTGGSPCTSSSGCQPGHLCVGGICRAPLCVDTNMSSVSPPFLCYPYSGNVAVSPTQALVQVIVSSILQSRTMLCCPNNGTYGSLATTFISIPSGCQGSGDAFTNLLIGCHQMRGNPTAGGVQQP